MSAANALDVRAVAVAAEEESEAPRDRQESPTVGEAEASRLSPPEAGGTGLAVEASVRAEALESGERRRVARSTGHSVTLDLRPTVGERIASLLVETPADVIRLCARQWPALWQRVLAQAREEQVRPGPMLMTVIERGLDAMADQALHPAPSPMEPNP